MSKSILFTLSILLFFITACNEKKSTPNFFLKANHTDLKYQLNERLSITTNVLSDKKIEYIIYSFQGKEIKVNGNNPLNIELKEQLLGKHTLTASVFYEGKNEKSSIEITLLNDASPKVLNYKIVNTYPHNTKHYTQGLEFSGSKLYESAGKYKTSKLLQKELTTGETIKEHVLKDTYFGEGLTIVNNKIHQLTWKANLGFTYNLEDLKPQGTFAYNDSKEGWGLCYDGENTIYKSDGTTKIWKLDAKTLAETGFIQVATNKSIKSKFNELEWVNGKIYANTWQKDGIAIINPKNGAIESIINLKGIRSKVGVSKTDNDKVLNGIAYKEETDQLFITGKYWNSLFEIEVID